MKALFVGDNRYGPNWGGRGASIALYQLIEQEFEVSAVVPGTLFPLGGHGLGYVNTLTPPRYAWLLHHMLSGRKKRRLFDWYVRTEELLGARDFIRPDPPESVEHILRYKDRYPVLQQIYTQAADADVVVVNGEGDMVFTTPPRREALFLLAMAELGFRLKKRVFFVNAMLSDCPVTGRNHHTVAAARRVLSQCDTVTLRDFESLEYAKETMPEIEPSFVPDSLFAWFSFYQHGCAPPPNGDFVIPFPEEHRYLRKLDFSRPYICVGGGGLAAASPQDAVRSYTRLVQRIRGLGLPVYLTKNCGRDAFLDEVAERTGVGVVPATTSILMAGAILANARVFISGRYHPSILASLGGTPCIFLATTAHKMGSLPRLLGYPDTSAFSACPSDAEIDDIVARAQWSVASAEPLRHRIRSAAATRCDEARQLPILLRRTIDARFRSKRSADHITSAQLPVRAP